MCGICGVVLDEDDCAPVVLDTLTSLQHRGQDAAGMAITNDFTGHTLVRKGNGLVSDVFKEEREVQRLVGRSGIGHVRYPTAGSSDGNESQPFYCNHPWGCSLAHNGNLTNTETLQRYCKTVLRRQINTFSDSELILAVFAHELSRAYDEGKDVGQEAMENAVFKAVEKCMELCEGAYAIIIGITGIGIVGFRDPHGIRPLCFGRRNDGVMLSSESVAIEISGFTLIRDVNPGEAVLLRMNPLLLVSEGGSTSPSSSSPSSSHVMTNKIGNILDARIVIRQCASGAILSPCIFEYVYFARPDSVLDGVCVYDARVNMGDRLAQRVRKQHPNTKIDVVIPIPSTSRVSAVQCAVSLGVPYMEGLVRNRYSQRTFIMPGQKKRTKGVRMKLNPVPSVIKGKNVLLVDDSIVRGTTSKHIVEIVRGAGASAVYFASAAPAIRFPNVYGIDMPSRAELIAHGRDEQQVAEAIGADWVVYQDLQDLVNAVRTSNPQLISFDMSCFDGVYVAGDLPDSFFDKLHAQRNDEAKETTTTSSSSPNNGSSSMVMTSSSMSLFDPAKSILRYASPFHSGRMEIPSPMMTSHAGMSNNTGSNGPMTNGVIIRSHSANGRRSPRFDDGEGSVGSQSPRQQQQHPVPPLQFIEEKDGQPPPPPQQQHGNLNQHHHVSFKLEERNGNNNYDGNGNNES
jgi:amidophosphoribosyltransferase